MRGAVTILTALAVWAPDAAAQTIRGLVIDQANERPVPTAGVFLLDADRDPVARALSDAAGRYALRVPGDGEYVLFVQRMGYFETESPLLAVTADRDYDVDLTVRPEPIRIAGLSVGIRSERIERWLTQANAGVSPHATFGYRVLQGPRLLEARSGAEDGIDLLRRLYLPVWNRPGGLCIGPHGGRGCLNYYVNGQALPPELVETVDLSRVETIVVHPPDLHVILSGFDWAPFFPMPIRR